MKRFVLAACLAALFCYSCSTSKSNKGIVGYRPSDPTRGEDGKIEKRSKSENYRRAEYFNALQHKNYIKNF
jgi:hypothetical protein